MTDILAVCFIHSNGMHRAYRRKVMRMPKYVIERTLPGAGELTEAELHGISAKSNQVLSDLGPGSDGCRAT